jgi:hypothetical protein
MTCVSRRTIPLAYLFSGPDLRGLPERSPRGLHKPEIESTDSNETFASLISRNVCILVVIINMNKVERGGMNTNGHNLNVLLLIRPSYFYCPGALTTVNSAPFCFCCPNMLLFNIFLNTNSMHILYY